MGIFRIELKNVLKAINLICYKNYSCDKVWFNKVTFYYAA
ncbi:hypothetical protein HDC90_001064 [Pedobacter sp. AK013]|nr:hypothetical protein [Pedobacter sp. AK013]